MVYVLTRRTYQLIAEFNSVLNHMLLMTNANIDGMRVHHETWAQQFKDAMNVNGGDVENASSMDYVMHFLTFGFKIVFALIPPAGMAGGWPCFIFSLIMIGILTAIVGDLASIFGCLVGLKDSVTGRILPQKTPFFALYTTNLFHRSHHLRGLGHVLAGHFCVQGSGRSGEKRRQRHRKRDWKQQCQCIFGSRSSLVDGEHLSCSQGITLVNYFLWFSRHFPRNDGSP